MPRILVWRSSNPSLLSTASIIVGLATAILCPANTTLVKNVDAVHNPEDPGRTACQNDLIYPTDPIVVGSNDFSGLRLPVGNQIERGLQVELTSFVKEACGHAHPASVIIEVRDPKDVTIFLGLQIIEQIQPYSITEIGMSWTAPEEPGTYEMRVFTLVDLNITGFGRVAISTIEVVLPQE